MRCLFAIAVTLAASPAFAGAVKASLDRSQITIDDEVTLTLSVTGDSEQPSLPASLGADFDATSSGQASQVSIINGRMSQSTKYSFTLVPKHTGTLVVPAITVSVDGVRIASDPLQLMVTAARAAASSTDDLFVTADLQSTTPGRTTAFVGEQLVYTVRIHARVNASCPTLRLPDITGATVYDLGDQRQYKMRDGNDELSVVEIRRALFPTKPGLVEIPAVRLQCSVEREDRRRSRDDFGSIFGPPRAAKVIRSGSVKMSIEALPPGPPDFSGLVGQVSVGAQLSRSDASQGESVTLTVTAHGNADMSGAPEPAVRASDFKAYDDKPTTRSEGSGDELVGERSFAKALVAQRSGDLTISIDGLVYFDPARRTYATATAAPLTLHVGGGSAASSAIAATPMPAPPLQQTTTEQPSSAAPHGFTQRGPSRLATLTAAWLSVPRILVLLIVPLALAVALRGLNWRRRRDPIRERRRVAARTALAKLASIPQGNADEVSRILRELIGERLSGNGRALSTDEALESLSRSDVPPELVTRTRDVLVACDAAVYGGASGRPLRDEAVAVTRQFAEGA